MKITVQCSFCNKFLSVGSEHAGKKIQCPVCKATVQLPDSQSQPAAPTPPPQQQHSSKPRRPSAKPATQQPVRDREQQRRRPVERPKSERQGRSQQRRQPRHDPDEIWNQPLSSRGAAISEDDYEKYGLPARKKNKEQRDYDNEYPLDASDRRATSPMGSLNPLMLCLIVCCVCIVFAFAAAGVQSSSPDTAQMLAMPAIVVGIALSIAGGLRILGNAFGEDLICGFLYIFFPLYSVYFVLNRWDINSGPLLVTALGTITSAVGWGCSGIVIN